MGEEHEEQDFRNEVLETIDDIENENAVRHLPPLERRIYEELREAEMEKAKRAGDIEEYYADLERATDMVAKRNNLSEDEVKAIALRAERMIDELIGD
jgi:hypothetical protein